ncbi:MAG: sulfite exporter TauE/SafE family protein [Bacteroidetes bacterium]|nr:sulfite exporter TauE/SafE family protein [Bacteroidota bacterium]
MLLYAQIALAALIAGTLDTAAGLGGGLLLLPMLAMLTGSKDAVLLSALIPLGWNLPRLVLLREWVNWRVALLFAVGIVPGTYIGAWLLELLDAHVLSTAIGGLLILFGIYYILKLYVDLPEPRGMKRGWFPVVGLVSGVIGALLGAGHGPLQTGALIASSMSVREIAGTNGALGSIVALSRIAGYAVRGILDSSIFLPAAVGMVGAWGGAHLGVHLIRRSKDATLELVIAIVLVIAGAKMLYTGLH